MYTLYVRDSNKEKRSQKASIDPGVLPCSILRIWGLWARTKNDYTVDDIFILTIREPWLFKRISTSNASAWLAGGKLMLQGRRELQQGTNSTEISKRPLRRKRRLLKESQIFLYERSLQAGTSEQSCSHLCLTLWIWGVDNSLFWGALNFKSWCDAHAREDTMHMLVWYGAHDAR
jgi:hypothetical protein